MAVPIDLQESPQAALVCAVLSPGAEDVERAVGELSHRFGPVRERSAVYDFDYSSYYEAEMGAGLVKQLVWFDERVLPEQLPDIKLQTMEVERQLSGGGVIRTANIDPGLVSVESLVLVSTKYSGHRICIARGLFAETTLLFQKGGCRALEWTYPDYRSDLVQAFLLKIRRDLLDAR